MEKYKAQLLHHITDVYPSTAEQDIKIGYLSGKKLIFLPAEAIRNHKGSNNTNHSTAIFFSEKKINRGERIKMK